MEDILQRYREWLQEDSIFGYIVRVIIKIVIDGLYWLSSTLEKSIDKILTLTSFYKDSSEINTAYQAMLYLGFGFLIIFIIFLGYKFWLGKNIEIKNVFLNTLIITASIVLLPTVYDFGLQLSKQFYEDTKSLGQTTAPVSDSLSFNVISDNIVDLVYADQQDFPDLNQLKKNRITKEQWEKGQVDLLENAEPDGLLSAIFSDKDKLKHDDVFKHQLTIGTDGKLKAVELNQKSFPFWDTWYFRYGMKSGAIISTLLVLSVAYGLSGFKLVRVIIELVVQKLIFPFVSFSDIETAQKLKGMWQDIAQSFLTIAMIGLNLRIFVLFQTWLSTKNLNTILYFFISLIAALVAIDGADTFRKHFGTDVGLKDEWRSFLGLYAASKAVNAVGGVAKDVVSGTANMVGKTGNALKPHIDNIKSGKTLNDMKEGMQNAGEFVGQQVGYMEEGNWLGHTAKSAQQGAKQFTSQAVDSLAKPFTTTASAVKDLANSAKEGYQSGNEQAIYDTIQERKDSMNQEKTLANDKIEDVSKVAYPTRITPTIDDESHHQTGNMPTNPYETIQNDINSIQEQQKQVPTADSNQGKPTVSTVQTEPILSQETDSVQPMITNQADYPKNQGNHNDAISTETIQTQTDMPNSNAEDVEPNIANPIQNQHVQEKEKKQFNTDGLIVDKDVTLSSLRNNKENVQVSNEQQPGSVEQNTTELNQPNKDIQLPPLSTEIPKPENQSVQDANVEMKQGTIEHQVNQEIQNVQDQKVNVKQDKTNLEGVTETHIDKKDFANTVQQPEFATQASSYQSDTKKTKSYERIQENQVTEHEHVIQREINHTHRQNQSETVHQQEHSIIEPQSKNTQQPNQIKIDNQNHSTKNQ